MGLSQKKMNALQEVVCEFTQKRVENFIKEHKDEIFYAFAYDCNAEYAEVNLCFNTRYFFEKTLARYQTGKYAQEYKTKDGVYKLKYSLGDWEYQCFDTLYFLAEEEMVEIYGVNIEEQITEFMHLCRNALLDFTHTNEFAQIPKTDDFMVLCIDHDESLEAAQTHLNALETTRTSA